jgi:hypothetical protein
MDLKIESVAGIHRTNGRGPIGVGNVKKIRSRVDDPHYLNQPFITSTHFKREPDRSKWMPTPCEPGSSSK